MTYSPTNLCSTIGPNRQGGLKAKKREPQLLEALSPKSSDGTTLPQIFAVPSAQTDKEGLTAKKKSLSLSNEALL